MNELIINGKTPKGTILSINDVYYVIQSFRKIKHGKYKIKVILQSELLNKG